jgi:hypothetical protein
MINWEKLSEYVENPPPVLIVESSDLFNNVLVRNPLQVIKTILFCWKWGKLKEPRMEMQLYLTESSIAISRFNF